MEVILVIQNNRRTAEQQRQRCLALHRQIRDTCDPFNDPLFRSLYRLTPDMAKSVISDLRQFFPSSLTSASLPIELKVLAALHFYGQGSYQKPDGRDACISLSQASVSRAISQTTVALNNPRILSKWIKFPFTEGERQQIIQKNYLRFGIPGVLGYVDGTHILMKKPAEHEDLFINRKGQHSLNVQVVCDSDLVILNILAKYPGGTHDAYIWRSSLVRDKMVLLENSSCWLLGDSGYPLDPWLLTPILNAEPNSPEANYTEQHIRSRNCIERCFGVLKSRFRCLHKHRVLEYTPKKVGMITNACAVLHNMCIKAGVAEPEEIDIDDHSPTEPIQQQNQQIEAVYNRGHRVRINLINRLI